MNHIVEVEVPTAPDNILEKMDNFVLVPPMAKVGDYLLEGELIFCIDVGTAILEIEVPQRGLVTEVLFNPGDEVKPNDVVAKLNASAEQPSKDKVSRTFNIGSFLSGAFGAILVLAAYGVISKIL